VTAALHDAVTATSTGFPVESVDAHLRQQLPALGRITEVRKFAVGQSNPTYLLTTDTGRYVLRAKPAGRLLPSAHAVDREFRVLRALHGSEVPVPRPLHLCTDEAVLGSMFYVMAYIPGSIHLDPAMPGVAPTLRRAVYAGAATTLAALSRLDPVKLGLGDFGRHDGYFERQIRRWTDQYRATETERRVDVEALISWLQKHLPPDPRIARLVHGDFRLDNLIVGARGDVLAVLDWELSTLGHPYADLAYQCAQWRLPAGEMRGLKGVERKPLGLPSEEEYVGAYCKSVGVEAIEHWNFYLAVSLFRLAAICQGVYRRGLDGNASSAEAVGFGRKTDIIAAHAVEIISRVGG